MYEHSSDWSRELDSSRANKVKVSDDRHHLLSKNSVRKSDYINTTQSARITPLKGGMVPQDEPKLLDLVKKAYTPIVNKF